MYFFAENNEINPQPLHLLWRVLGLSRCIFLPLINEDLDLHLSFKGAHMSPRETVRHCESQVICREYREMLMVRSRTICWVQRWWSESGLPLLLLLLRQEVESTRGAEPFISCFTSTAAVRPLHFTLYQLFNLKSKLQETYTVQNKNSLAFCKSSMFGH